MKRSIGTTVLLGTALAAVSCACAQSVVLRAADVLVPLNQTWLQAYAGHHPNVTIQPTGAATATTFEALDDPKTDLVIVSRAIKYKEMQAAEAALGKRPVDSKLGVNGVAVYVNSENPIKMLTYAELAGIFTAKYRNWKDLGGHDAPITLYATEAHSASSELFREDVLEGKPTGAQLLADSGLLSAVAKDQNAIGFGPLAQVEGTRPLAIKRAPSSTPVTPTDETIANRTYPISRYIYAYVNPASDKPDAKTYVDFIRSDEGQQLLKGAGFYPLPAKLRSSQ